MNQVCSSWMKYGKCDNAHKCLLQHPDLTRQNTSKPEITRKGGKSNVSTGSPFTRHKSGQERTGHSQRSSRKESRPCFQWMRKGSCEFGDKCKYQHNPKSGALANLRTSDSQPFANEPSSNDRGSHDAKSFLEGMFSNARLLKAKEDRRHLLRVLTEYRNSISMLFQLVTEDHLQALGVSLVSEATADFVAEFILPLVILLMSQLSSLKTQLQNHENKENEAVWGAPTCERTAMPKETPVVIRTLESKVTEMIETRDAGSLILALRNARAGDARKLLLHLLESPLEVDNIIAGFAASKFGAELPVPREVTEIKVGIEFLKKGRWLDAFDFFCAQKARLLTNELLVVFIALCEFHLGNDVSLIREKSSGQSSAWRLACTIVNALVMSKQVSDSNLSLPSVCVRKAIAYGFEALLHPLAAHMGTLRLLIESLYALKSQVQLLLTAESPIVEQIADIHQERAKLSIIADRAASSEALKKLDEMIGLHEVKESLVQVRDTILLDKEREFDVSKQQYNAKFLGNPGSGKTTVSRLFAELLVELDVITSDVFIETSGARLVAGGTELLQSYFRSLRRGGVLFVDEAYQLKTSNRYLGGQLLDLLLKEMEDRRGSLIVIFAGYQKDLERLFEHNEGLPSRFRISINFPDFSDTELMEIMNKQLASTDPPFSVARKYVRIASRRLGRQRGTRSFGNARAVRNFLEDARSRQATRVIEERRQGKNPLPLVLSREDLLGPRTLDVRHSPSLQRLSQMTGLRRVKESVQQLLSLVATNNEREELELPLQHIILNRLFLGSPGTGKTTVANIYGGILRELHLLSKGEVIVKSPSDFIGEHIGSSERKTNRILDSSLGCVLVIDEAYGFHKGSNQFKTAVVDEIVSKVQGVPGEDRCVLLLGYESEMSTFMRESNPGLQRRFQIENAFHFPDYVDTELIAILLAKSKEQHWNLPFAVARNAVKLLAKERARPNFGNAGAVTNLLSQAALRFEDRMKDKSPRERALDRELVDEDFDALGYEEEQKFRSNPDALFEDLVGCHEIVEYLRTLRATILHAQSRGRDPKKDIEMNLLFVGPPGTGKTTIAKRMGMLFMSLGLLPRSDVTVCSASDFSTGFIGQAGKQTRRIFESALGGVLLIDEAYRLKERTTHGFMTEAVDEIVNMLTEDKFMGNMVVIFAGYEGAIDDMIFSVNAGLRSRVTEKVRFRPLKASEGAEMLENLLQVEGYQFDTAAKEALLGMMKKLVAAKDWSSGRDIHNWCKGIKREAALQEMESSSCQSKISQSTLKGALDKFLKSKCLA